MRPASAVTTTLDLAPTSDPAKSITPEFCQSEIRLSKKLFTSVSLRSEHPLVSRSI